MKSVNAETGKKYQVFCRSPRRGRPWVEYSAKFDTFEEAQNVKQRAESRHTLDLDGKELMYKIMEV